MGYDGFQNYFRPLIAVVFSSLLFYFLFFYVLAVGIFDFTENILVFGSRNYPSLFKQLWFLLFSGLLIFIVACLSVWVAKHYQLQVSKIVGVLSGILVSYFIWFVGFKAIFFLAMPFIGYFISVRAYHFFNKIIKKSKDSEEKPYSLND